MAKTSEEKQPYLCRVFWANPDNHYWESPIYNEKFKKKQRAWVKEVTKVNCGTIL